MGKTKLALSKLLTSDSDFVLLKLLHLIKYKLPQTNFVLLLYGPINNSLNTLYMLVNFSCFCCGLVTFFKINDFIKKNLSRILSECQFGSKSGRTTWVLVQNVCKDHQQRTKLAATVVPTKSDSDVIFCLQLLSKTLTCTLHLS